MQQVIVAALQMVSTEVVADNLSEAHDLLTQAKSRGAQLAALPEYFGLMGLKDDDKLRHAEAPTLTGERAHEHTPMQYLLSQQAMAHGMWIIGGTLPIKTSDPQRVRNACTVWAPDGRLAARYDKIHLFAFNNGAEQYDEGRHLEAGTEAVAVDAAGMRVGLSVCYDLRFAELYRQMCLQPCDLLSVPAAFTHTTGQAHWEVLLRARAIENLCHVVAPAQGGLHRNGRRTWGHSMIIDPWGQVLACLPEGPGVITATVDLEAQSKRRAHLPALAHRRV